MITCQAVRERIRAEYLEMPGMNLTSDQVARLWMPYDNGFIVAQPSARNLASIALRRTDSYGSPHIARVWLDK